jgi:hypothetical protein
MTSPDNIKNETNYGQSVSVCSNSNATCSADLQALLNVTDDSKQK